jgi:hypothetical protein
VFDPLSLGRALVAERARVHPIRSVPKRYARGGRMGAVAWAMLSAYVG